MNTRTCSKYLQPLLGHHLFYYYGQSAAAVLQGCRNPHVQLFCTHKKIRPRQIEGRSEPTKLRSKPTEFRSKPTEFRSKPTEFRSKPTEFRSKPTEFRSKPTEFRSEEHRPFRSVFAAGTARRTAEMLKKREGRAEEKEEEEEMDRCSVRYKASSQQEIPDRPLSPEEWRKLRDDSSRPDRFPGRMLNLMLAAGTDIDVAKSLLAFIALDSGTVPYVLLLKYLSLCVSGGHHSEVLDTYDLMKSCFKTLDIGAYSLLLKGISRTERWREMLPMLEEIKKIVTPTRRNYGDAISGAFLNGDSETGWTLYNEMMELGLEPNQEVWQCMFNSATSLQKDKEKLLDILIYMRENQVYPQEMLVKSIKTWFQSLPGEGWTGRFSSVDSRDRCGSCQAEMESIELTEEEYSQLKQRVMANVIEGRDVFFKTTPQELQSFKNFVKKSPAFDVIVDGLNVANISVHGPKSQNLLAVVSELCDQGLTVLVLGRKHMMQHSKMWNRYDILKIKQIAHCFFTDNISKDDPFLLYAALHSGNNCKFVSRDLMRDHKACLPDSATRRLFFKWQRGHQLVVPWYVPGKKVRFQRELRYDTVVQSTPTSWHLPYDEDGEDRSSYEIPQKWLCLTKQH
ncbi:mitochondrial ribonuclease P protein 3 [Astyanax mexicanus]|uniref:Mitochondrial ribonuclease P catalytic subunit n=1 Tax=Astyanax mexicanus TaxID=7994 RepID=A0A8T2LGG4_ASTMX|nr:mitochondrial ribonuclease P protein 3 [Astyanax mexicanus]